MRIDRRHALFVLFIATLAPSVARADAVDACIAAADSGQDLRDKQQYARARDAFATCSRPSCPAPIARSCATWAREVDDAMPTVTLEAKDDRGARLTDVRVTIDGGQLVDRLDATPLPLDPGEHTLRFERAGSETIDARVRLRPHEKGHKVSVVLKTLAPAPDAPPPPAPPAPTDTSRVAPPPPTEGTRDDTATARYLASGLVLVAAVGVTIGGYLYAQRSKNDDQSANAYTSNIKMAAGNSDASKYCSRNMGSNDCVALATARDDQNRDATISTVLYVAGGVLLVGSIVTFFAWPRAGERRSGLYVAPTLGGARLGGSF